MDLQFLGNAESERAETSTEASLAMARSSERESTKISWYVRIARSAVYVAAVLIPLLYLPFTSNYLEINKQLVIVVLASVALVVWLLGVVVSGKLSLRVSVLDKGILALVIATGIAALASLSPGNSFLGPAASVSDAFVTVAALAVLYWVALNVLRDRGRALRRVVIVAGAVALVVGLFQMLTWYILPGDFAHSRAFNTVGSINALGVLAAVLIPLFSKSTSKGWGIVGQVVAWTGMTASLVILTILNWWVLWVIALAGMLAMIGFDSINAVQMASDYAASKRTRFALGRFVVPMVVIVLGAFLLLVRFDLSSVKGQFPVEIAPGHSMSFGIAKHVLGQDLLFGYGPETFSLAFDRFGASQLANSQFSSARFFDGSSQFINFLVHGGAFMILALAVLLWSMAQVVARLGTALTARLGAKDGGSEATEASGVLSSMVAMTFALFLYPFSTALLGVWFFLMVLAALVVSGDRSWEIDIERKPAFSLSASLGFIIGLIVALTAVYFTFVRYLGDVAYARALRSETPEAALAHMARAVSLDDSDDRYYRDASQITLIQLRDELNASDDDAERPARVQNLMSSAVQLARRATELEPHEALNWENLASVYRSLTGLVDSVEQLAQEAYTRASELRPGDPSYDNSVGSMWLARADLIQQVAVNATGENRDRLVEQYEDSLERAEAAFSRALEQSPSLGLAIYNRAAVYDRQGRVSEATEAIETILPANANNPTLIFELGILYLRDGRNEEAHAAMQQAVLLAPDYANARWYLALLLEEQGDIESALVHLRRIEEQNPDNEVLLAKIAQLEQGEQDPTSGEVIDQEPLQDVVDPDLEQE